MECALRRRSGRRSTHRPTLTALAILAVLVLAAALVPPALAQATDPSQVRLVVVLLRGWGSTSRDETFGSIAPVLARVGTAPDANAAIHTAYFSYRYPDADYGPCDTSESLGTSAARLDAQVQDLADRYPNARLMLVGHSLGGVVAAYWAAAAGSPTLVKQTAAVVALNSPLQGIPAGRPEVREWLVEWLRSQLCGGGQLLGDLDAAQREGPLWTLPVAVDRLAQGDGRLYTGGSRSDIPIAWPTALLPGAEQRVFDSAVCPDWSALATGLLARVPDVRDVDLGGLWSQVRAQLSSLPPPLRPSALRRLETCIRVSHSNVLEDPSAIAWLAEIAHHALAGPTTDASAAPD